MMIDDFIPDSDFSPDTGFIPDEPSAHEKTSALIRTRKRIPFTSPTVGDVFKGALSLVSPTGAFNLPGDTYGRILQNVGAEGQREEASISGGIRGGIPGFIRGITGQEQTQLGDLLRDVNTPEPLAATGGLAASAFLPSSLLFGKVAKAAGAIPEASVFNKPTKPSLPTRAAGFALGVEPEALAQTKQIGYRKVLQEKYFDKALPARVQEGIESNLDNLRQAAASKYDEATGPLRQMPVNFEPIRQDVLREAEKHKVGFKPFGNTPQARLEERILKGAQAAQPETVGDVLDLRRVLDDLVYSEKTGAKKIQSRFADAVRSSLKNELHKNKLLADADKEWYDLESQLRDIGKKVMGDTGENFLGRFDRLTEKQKQKLVVLEKTIGGEPFVEDLTKFGLAKQFRGRPSQGIFFLSLARAAGRPLFRGALRASESLPAKAAFSAGRIARDIPEFIAPRTLPAAFRNQLEENP